MVAVRLVATDPSLSILVIESGKNNYNDSTPRNPVMSLSHLATVLKTARLYKAQPSEYLFGREAIIPAGNVLVEEAQSISCCTQERTGWISIPGILKDGTKRTCFRSSIKWVH